MIKSYKSAHILVQQKYEADDLLSQLKSGKSFDELARKFSSCRSASQGGDLGVIPIGKADPDFEEAALKLKTGEISSAPVRTRFGYHIIKRLG